MALAQLKTDRVGDIAAIGENDDVAGLDDDGAVRTALVGESMNVAGAPMVEMARFVGIAPLRHHRIFAAGPGQIGACVRCHVHLLGFGVEPLGVFHRLLEARRRHQLIEIVRRVDDHQHAHLLVHDRLEPAGEQRHVKDDDQIGLRKRFQRALALADRRHADLGPARDRVHAHFVDVGVQRIRRGERRLDVFAAGAEVGDERDGLAALDLAQLQFALKQHGQIRRIEFGQRMAASIISCLRAG